MEASKPKRRPGQKTKGGGYFRVPGLKPIREELGMSHRDLSAASGLSTPTIWYLEQDKHVAREKTLKKLAEGLGVSPYMLLQPPPEEDEMPDTG